MIKYLESSICIFWVFIPSYGLTNIFGGNVAHPLRGCYLPHWGDEVRSDAHFTLSLITVTRIWILTWCASAWARDFYIDCWWLWFWLLSRRLTGLHRNFWSSGYWPQLSIIGWLLPTSWANRHRNQFFPLSPQSFSSYSSFPHILRTYLFLTSIHSYFGPSTLFSWTISLAESIYADLRIL